MKRYVIRNSDGSEQSVMKSVHSSRKQANETLITYICNNNASLDDDNDDDYLSPFDFTIDEVGKDVSECITDFDSARKALGLMPNDDVKALRMEKRTPKTQTDLTCINQFVNEFNPEQIEALIALNKLFTIAQAWNEDDGFVPDFSNNSQSKYCPYFMYFNDIAKFTLCGTRSTVTCDALCLNRICFKTETRAKQFGEKFIDLFNQVLLK